MSDERPGGQPTQRVPDWASGGVIFAAAVMILSGVFQALQGLAAIIEDEFFVQLPNYAFDIDLSTWGWIHLIVGAIVALAGFYLLAGSPLAAAAAIGLACASAIINFLFIPFYPFWALLIIAIDVFVVWAVVRSGILDSSRT